MQSLLMQSSVCQSLRSLPTARAGGMMLGATRTMQLTLRPNHKQGALAVTAQCKGATDLFSRSFGSERHWKPRVVEETLPEEPISVENMNDGPQQVQFWQNEAGALVAEHNEIEDIEGCQWVIRSVCERLRQPSGTPNQAWNKLKALRFLLDLEETITKLSDEGFGTCAVELFERPWVVSCDQKTEILRLRPRPDGVLRRAAFAALSPIIAPVGALHTYVKSGGYNALASFKWYFRAIAEISSKVDLDRSYRVEGRHHDPQACLSLEDARSLVVLQREIKQLAV